MNAPIQVPMIAGAPATAANAAKCRRPGLFRTTGAAMPTPSVTLWRVNPTIRNTPSAVSPRAKALPIANPSPRLCSPIPTAIW